MTFSRKKENKENKKKKGVFQKIKELLFCFVFLLFLGVSIWTLFFSTFLQIKQASTGEIFQIKEAELQNQINNTLSEKYFDFLPKNNLLIFPKKKIEEELRQKFPLIKNITITRRFPDKIELDIEERLEWLAWKSNEEIWVVDENGEIFARESQIKEKNAFLVIIRDESGKKVEPGNQVVTADLFIFSFELQKAISQNGSLLELDELTVPMPFAEEIAAKSKEGWRAIFSAKQDPQRQMAILRKIIQESIGEEKRKDLDYVDLRVKGKAVYKLKTEGEGQEEQDNNIE